MSVCERSRAHMDEHGELVSASPEVVAHVSGCSGCLAEAELRQSLKGARREAGRELSSEREEAIFQRVARAVRTQPMAEPRRGWAWAVVGGFAAAVAILLVTLPFMTAPVEEGLAVEGLAVEGLADEAPGDEGPAQEGQEGSASTRARARWVSQDRGVFAWLENGEAELSQEDDTAVLTLRRGTVLVHFDRSAAPGPLVVRTPEAEVWVRGTVFFVDASAPEATEVGVLEGRVVVRGAGQTVTIDPGKGAVAEADEAREETPSASLLEQLRERFLDVVGAPDAEGPVAPPLEEDSTEPADPLELIGRSERPLVRRGRPPRRSEAPPGVQEEEGREDPPEALSGRGLMERAAEARRRGDHAAAEQALRAALATGTLRGGAREEALYQLATALRGQRRFVDAVEVLHRLSESSGSRAARLALLDRARLLAYQLGDPSSAERLLAQVAGGSDALAREAGIERCILRLERGSRAGADACLESFLQRFPSQRQHPKVRLLESRLRGLRQ